ncbi:MAG: ABC transporter ATP-binding protein, partial [Verrucomicrobiae bacterium]|nr:ABC transporter ATP-binding protein [Verrucomicrobiae bacterium]
QSFTRESAEAERFAGQVDTAFHARWRQHRLEVAYLALVALVLAAGTACIVWIGSRHVADGRLSVGTLLVFVAYLVQLYEPLNQLSHVGSTVSQARAGAGRVLELLDSEPGVPAFLEGSVTAPVPSGPLDLEFDDVSFAHVPGSPVLRDLRFHLLAGEAAALVGSSGAGKSTLLHLIPRLLEPDAGIIRIGGVDARRLSLDDLRRHVALVPQESRLLPGTVADNIAIGRDGATREAIESAARAAHADRFIRRLPKGYDTVVGEGAARLSLGEQQRIGIARAFLKDAPILLLDEPTSALDEASERAVLEGLHALMRGRTVLLVTHRSSAWRGMPRVLRLEGGRLIEETPGAS